MDILALTADERVVDVKFTKDTLSGDLGVCYDKARSRQLASGESHDDGNPSNWNPR